MKQKILPVDKYDKTYKKEYIATIGAVIIAVLGGLILPTTGITPSTFQVAYVIGGIFGAIWVYDIAGNQNREPGWLTIFAFLFPVVALLIMGLSRKQNLRFEIDTSYSKEDQYNELKKYAKSLLIKASHAKRALCISTLLKICHSRKRMQLFIMTCLKRQTVTFLIYN